MNLVESVPPKVSSPLVDSSEVVGSKETATRLDEMSPFEKALSTTANALYVNVGHRHSKDYDIPVGMSVFVPGLRVPWVRSTGPILRASQLSRVNDPSCTYPRIPSTPEKPDEDEATPTPWLGMTSEPMVTVSVHSVPENEPEP